MDMIRWVFWSGFATAAYVYVGYPLLLGAWARFRPRPVRKAAADALPDVSIVIAARNEATRLARRLNNLLALDYPGRRQIIVVSDGSTDGTAAIAAQFAPAVEVVAQRPLGKAAALNAGVARARHPIVVFADARQRFAPDTLRHLCANFADPSVGAVSGELILEAETDPRTTRASSVAEGVGLYWRYEKWLRRRESRVASTVGVTGAVYAMRRECWRPLPTQTLLDDVLAPMRVVLSGKRVIFDEAALAFDHAAPDLLTERLRKIRTLAGNYQLIGLEPRLLVPLANPIWLQFVSHKLGRLVVPYALIACLLASALLVGSGLFYTAAFAVQAVLVVLAVYGAWLDSRTRRLTRQRAGLVAPASPFADKEHRRTKRVVNA